MLKRRDFISTIDSAKRDGSNLHKIVSIRTIPFGRIVPFDI